MNEPLPSRTSRYHDALAAIWDRSGYDRGFISNPFAGDDAARLGLVRTRRLLDQLGAPDADLNIVHVAGSNGKGSTCAFIESVARAAGYRTGRYTSPHLHQFRERFAVDGVPIAEADFAEQLFAALAATESVEREEPALGAITAFELTTAMAFAVLTAHGCELAIIETGMGGTLDATNVVSPLAAAITPLDYEHTAVLGATMTEIAGNKAGIIKAGRPVAVAAQPAEAMPVIAARADELGSPLLRAERDWRVSGSWQHFTAEGPWGHVANLRSGLVGAHQMENTGLALAVCDLLTADGFRFSEPAMRSGIATTTWPGRFEEVSLASGQRIVVDGAHSPAAARVLADALAARYPGERAAFVLGVLADKDVWAFVAALAGQADHWVLAKPAGPRGRPVHQLLADLDDIQPPPRGATSVAEAIDLAIDTGASLIVVAGSLATVAEARVALGLATNDPAP